MLEDYSGVIIGVAIAAAVCIVLYFVIKRPKDSNKSAHNVLPAQPLSQHSSGNLELTTKLRQNLRLKVMYDEAKVDRLIDFERKKNPNASETELMKDAIDRWERDNR